MDTTARRRWAKLALLGTLYFSQGVPFGFFMQAVPVVLRQQNYDLKWIGLSSLLALPWGLKWIWAPLVDRVYSRRFGRRRSWIVPLQLLSVLAFGVLALLPVERALTGLIVGCFVSSALAATLDIATDGLAVELLEPDERGLGNGVQVGAYRLGMVAGGGGLLIVFDRIGWSVALQSMAALLLVASVPVVLHKEQHASDIRVPPLTGTGFVKQPGVWLWLLVLVVYKTGDAFATGMLRPFLVDAGLSLSDIAVLLGSVGSLASLLGAAVGGSLSSRLGSQRALTLFALLTAVCLAGYAAAAAFPALGAGQALGLVLVSLEHVVSSMATVALFACMMSYCRKGSEGGDYTLQASVVVGCTGTASALSGFSAASLGYTSHFALAAVFTLCVAFALGSSTRWLERSR